MSRLMFSRLGDGASGGLDPDLRWLPPFSDPKEAVTITSTVSVTKSKGLKKKNTYQSRR